MILWLRSRTVTEMNDLRWPNPVPFEEPHHRREVIKQVEPFSRLGRHGLHEVVDVVEIRSPDQVVVELHVAHVAALQVVHERARVLLHAAKLYFLNYQNHSINAPPAEPAAYPCVAELTVRYLDTPLSVFAPCQGVLVRRSGREHLLVRDPWGRPFHSDFRRHLLRLLLAILVVLLAAAEDVVVDGVAFVLFEWLQLGVFHRVWGRLLHGRQNQRRRSLFHWLALGVF